MIIELQGVDGTGKTTQAGYIAQELQRRGKQTELIHFPRYEGMMGDTIRNYQSGEIALSPYQASLIYTADRMLSFCTGEFGQDAANTMTIFDRYTNGNIIHQMCLLPQEEWPDYVQWLYELEYGYLKLPRPELVVCLMLPEETIQKQLAARQEEPDIIERDMERTRKSLEVIHWAETALDWKLVDCSRPDGSIASRGDIFLRVMREIDSFL